VLASVEGYDAVQCEVCAFIHVVPLPTSDELREYYATNFYEESKPDYLESASRDREWLNIGYDTKLDMLEEALELDPRRAVTRPRILDIGSGPGHFLLRAKERGWEAVGLEAAPAAVEFSRRSGLEVHQGYFEGVDRWNLGSFDAVHMQHVLEHVPDPRQLLDGVRRMMKPNSAVCIEVPNDFSVIQEVVFTGMDFPPWWVAPPEHLNYFSKEALTQILRRCSFTDFSWSTQFPIDMLLLAGVDYVRDVSLGKKAHSSRVDFETVLVSKGMKSLLIEFYARLVNSGLGRELIVTGISNDNR
jgi:SAM-dependent methyltransferase